LNTNAQGEYVASPLRIGRYNVTVEKAGFKKAVAGPIVVNVQEPPEIDVTSSEMPVETLFAGQASRTGRSRSLRFPLSLRRGDWSSGRSSFNAFNHLNPEFANPNTISENVATENGSSEFGFAQAARDPRFIQFALKFYF
jgi:hypothetical protein